MKALAILVAVAAAAPSPTVPLALLSSAHNDYNLSLDRAETALVFARSEAEFRNARIFTARKTAQGWQSPAQISFSDHRYSDSDPWLTPDGDTLYFISDRPAPGRETGRSDYDIWRSARSGDTWSAPEHLGPEVNGPGQELGPELHNGILYFSSARRSGVGGLDVYQARMVGSGFEQASLLEGPFNTSASDSDFTLSPDGETAMFWRSSGDLGLIHIAYRTGARWFEPQPLPPEVNMGPFNFTPSFSSDGRRVRFASTKVREGQPAGLADIYEAMLPTGLPE